MSISNLTAAEKISLCQADIVAFKMLPKTTQMKINLDNVPTVESRIKKSWREDLAFTQPESTVSNSDPGPSSSMERSDLVSQSANSSADTRPIENLAALLLHAVEYVVILAKISSMVYKLNVLPCAVRAPWFIADGYIPDTFYKTEFDSVNKNFIITGILEPMPSIDEDLLNNEMKLQTNFMEETRWAGEFSVLLFIPRYICSRKSTFFFFFFSFFFISERIRKRRSLCKLSSLTKFRLCSSIYVTWTVNQDIHLLWQNFLVNYDVCISNATAQLPLLAMSPINRVGGSI